MDTILRLYIDYQVYGLAVVGCIIAAALVILAPTFSKK
jgi:hypothetical protein